MTEDSGDKAQEKASEGLSQLAARILNQLALSAWLPAACLVLAVAFILSLGTAAAAPGAKPAPEVVAALKALGHIGFQGIILMFVAVVVLTMLTQAFSFEAIRILEGYWGTTGLTESVAGLFCAFQRAARKRVERKLSKVTRSAWTYAYPDIQLEQMEANEPELSQKMIGRLHAQVLKLPSNIVLDPDDQEIVDSYDWTIYAPAETLRRRSNLQKKLRDFPQERHVQPTRLGNVLRHFEDETGAKNVETLVDEVFPLLPISLQVSHDEQRGRLDLYCSMTFVWLFVVIIIVAQFGWWTAHWKYGIALSAIAIVCAWFSYRAAIASARYYGSLLTTIAGYRPRPQKSGGTVAVEEAPTGGRAAGRWRWRPGFRRRSP